ncbi:MAG: hypothetical protein AAF717_08055 [Bacteroidota bacterium]
MNRFLILLSTLLILTRCQMDKKQAENIVTSDIINFWEAYDKITSTQDTVLQYKYLDSLYFEKGTLGLEGIKQARNYTANDYINAINNYPEFWNSVRNNTLRADSYRQEIQEGIKQLRQLYPALQPRRIYFTIGAMRTGGTYLDSLVLIGSEMAFADKNTVASELPEGSRQGRQAYFNQNPIDDVVFLAIQEYVHTQQNPFVHNLLSYCLHEGVGDFVSNTALGLEPKVPAIAYGKQNKAVREKFEKEMFYGNNVNEWLWSDAPNEFGVRDLGYFIGYQICENYYDQAENKKEAIKTMIELDYENESQIEGFIHKANFFSTSLDELYQNFENRRPTVIGIKQFENNSENVDPKIKRISVEFSRPLNGYNTGVDFGDLGRDAFPKNDINGRFWSEDNTSWTIPVELEPNKTYQILISNNFRTEESIPLKPYLIEFRTRNE